MSITIIRTNVLEVMYIAGEIFLKSRIFSGYAHIHNSVISCDVEAGG